MRLVAGVQTLRAECTLAALPTSDDVAAECDQCAPNAGEEYETDDRIGREVQRGHGDADHVAEIGQAKVDACETRRHETDSALVQSIELSVLYFQNNLHTDVALVRGDGLKREGRGGEDGGERDGGTLQAVRRPPLQRRVRVATVRERPVARLVKSEQVALGAQAEHRDGVEHDGQRERYGVRENRPPEEVPTMNGEVGEHDRLAPVHRV